jgi:hypothetical protein
MAARQKVQGHEKAVFQQLEKLQAQGPARTTTTSLPVRPAKPQTVASVPEPASTSRSVEPNQSPEAQAVKVELEADTQEATDVFWRNNSISQASQVHF